MDLNEKTIQRIRDAVAESREIEGLNLNENMADEPESQGGTKRRIGMFATFLTLFGVLVGGCMTVGRSAGPEAGAEHEPDSGTHNTPATGNQSPMAFDGCPTCGLG